MEMDANKKQAYGWCGRRSAGSTDVLEAEWDEMPLCLLILIGKDGIWEENMEKRLYTNGTIVTMERAYPTAEAVLTEGKYILAVGRRDALEKEADHIVNLNGKTMLPSFLDSHGHLMGVANGMLQADVSNAHSFAEIAEQIQRFLRQNAPREGQWVVATGADHGIMQEGRLPSKRFLDRITAAYPLVLQHISGHSGVFNSKGLAVLGITVESQSPAGGTIDYENGLLEENAFLQALEHIPLPDQNALLAAFGQAQRYYASYGITTAQEGMFVKQIHDIYQELYQREQLWMDVVAYVDLKNDPEGVDAFPHCRGKYHHHFRIGGYKVLLDGSPQSKTAWVTRPYTDGTRGLPIWTEDALEAKMTYAIQRGQQLLAHANGDAATDQYLRVYSRVKAQWGPALRPVLIHGQILRADQMAKLVRLEVIPSFFPAHVYHWGEVHIANLGMDRARNISAAGWAQQYGIPFTLHTDAPVVTPNILETMGYAVERKTRGGRRLGGEQRISPYEALQAVTLSVAKQYGEEAEKGSIRAGKLANFVVLDENPMELEGEAWCNTKVRATILAGKCVYRN